MKYLKVVFDDKSRFSDFKFKVDEVNIADIWNPNAVRPGEMGGFNFSCEEKIIRWLHNGDILYDVIVPEDAEMKIIDECATPGGVFRTNKIIITNPRKITDDMALEFYKKSTIPQEAYPNALGGVSIMGYDKTAKQILKDKVNINTIDYFLSEWNDFMSKKNRKNCNDTVKYIDEQLNNIKKIN